jgi:uncharacterized protein
MAMLDVALENSKNGLHMCQSYFFQELGYKFPLVFDKRCQGLRVNLCIVLRSQPNKVHEKMRKPKFEILAGKDSKIRFRLKAANGEIILAGRAYATKAEAIHGIASVMRYAALDLSYVRRESINGQFFFQIKSPSGRLLAWSEFYVSRQGRESGIEAVKRAVAYGRVMDLD